MNFLMSLNHTFASVRGQILLMELFPSLNKVFSLVTQEERQRRVGSNPIATETTAALFSKVSNVPSKDNYSNKPNAKKDRPICSHCGVFGHVVDKCYKIHGYPPGYKTKEKVYSVNRVSFTPANSADGMEELTMVALTSSQCQQLMSMLESHNLGSQQPNLEPTLGTHQAATLIT